MNSDRKQEKFKLSTGAGLPSENPLNNALTDSAQLDVTSSSLANRQSMEPDILKRIRDLEMHQIKLELKNIELKMQYDQLQQSKTNAELQASKYAELYDFSPAGLITISKDYEILELNLSAAMILGKGRSELINNRLDFIVSDDSRAEFQLFAEKVIGGHTREKCELVLIADDNSLKHVSLTGISDHDGNQCFISLTDITASKQNAERLSKYEPLFHAIFNEVPNQIAILDEKGTIIKVNRQWRDLAISTLADPKSVCEGSNYLASCDSAKGPDARIAKKVAAGIRAVIANRQPTFTMEYPCNTPDQRRWFSVKLSRFNSPGPLRLLVVHENISLVNQEKERLSHVAIHYKALLEAGRDSVCVADVNGNVFEINHAFCDLLGYSYAELLGMNISDWDAQWTHEELMARFKEQVTNPKMFETVISRKDGHLLNVEINISPVILEGRTLLYATIRDISERKKEEEKLIRSESQYRALFEHMEEGFALQQLIFDKNNNPVDLLFLSANASFERHTGIKPNNIIGKTMLSIWNQASPRLLEKYGQAAMKGEPLTFEYFSEINKRHLRIKAYCPQHGQLATIIEDITRLKQAEKKLRESEAWNRALISNIPDAIGIEDANSIITYFSPNIKNAFGWIPEELIGKNGLSFIHPDDLEKVQKLHDQLFENENATVSEEYRLLHKNGKYIPVDFSATNLLNDQVINGILLNFHDITAKKQREDELNRISTRLRLAVQSSNVGVWDFDIINKVLVWDDQMLKLYGIRRSDFPSDVKHWYSALHPDDRERCDKELQLAISDENNFDSEFRIVWPDGSVHNIKALAAVQRDESGRVIHLIGTNWDITPIISREAKINHQNKELLTLAAEKNRFFSIIAHDLRGPLGSIMGMTEMMVKISNRLSETERTDIITEMSISARNIFNLLENLLEWAKVQQGFVPFQPKSLNPAHLLKKNLEVVNDMARRKGITLKVEIADNIRVFADKYMLQAVIRNLISNAIKFTPEKGLITISAIPEENNRVSIRVKDTGIGMSEEIRNKLFHLDARVKRPGTNGESSTGLGLLICKEFVAKMGGEIQVKSMLYQGSVFSFTLPTEGNNDQQSIEEVIEIKEIKPKTTNIISEILIAEDDEISAMLLTMMVKKYSIHTHRAKTGKEAVEICRNNPSINLILMDIAMPVMDGYEATRQIRVFNKKVIILAQTTYVQSGESDKAIEVGCNDYIPKPFTHEALSELIKKYI